MFRRAFSRLVVRGKIDKATVYGMTPEVHREAVKRTLGRFDIPSWDRIGEVRVFDKTGDKVLEVATEGDGAGTTTVEVHSDAVASSCSTVAKNGSSGPGTCFLEVVVIPSFLGLWYAGCALIGFWGGLRLFDWVHGTGR